MSELVVMKFGGTSVGSSERIGSMAKRIARHRKERGDKVVVVVSAMSGETDRLLDLCKKVGGGDHTAREIDQALAAGEQVSCALMAIALQSAGVKSRSLVASQVGIRTKEASGQHLIESLDDRVLHDLLDQDIVPVVAGFQGVDDYGNFRTLGRGGSDNTAVALAAALGPCKCIIYTDIDGVYSALPSVCKGARKLRFVTYEEMLELAGAGAKVLQSRSVSLARKFKVPLFVRSSFSDDEGTAIVEEYPGMEDAVVSGITCRADQAKITIRELPDAPGTTAKVFGVLSDNGVLVDMIVQTQGVGGKTSLSLTVPQEKAQLSYDALAQLSRAEFGGAPIEVDRNIAKLSVVGEGMRSHVGVAADVFRILGGEGINADMITTSEIAITVAIDPKYSELAVRVLHSYFIEGNPYLRSGRDAESSKVANS